jgi:hypothetical protein
LYFLNQKNIQMFLIFCKVELFCFLREGRGSYVCVIEQCYLEQANIGLVVLTGRIPSAHREGKPHIGGKELLEPPPKHFDFGGKEEESTRL